jgi:hypothetical protein
MITDHLANVNGMALVLVIGKAAPFGHHWPLDPLPGNSTRCPVLAVMTRISGQSQTL